MPMPYYMGVDIGTTSVKAIAFGEAGEIICRQSVNYGMLHPQPGYSEQDPDEIFAAVTLSINRVIEQLQPLQPAFISFSAAMHSFIAVDNRCEPLTHCIIWADNRAAGVADGLLSTPQGEWLYHTTGVPVHAMSPLCKMIWLKKQQPAIFQQTYKFIGIKEYVFYKLFGTYAVDTAIASATGLLNTLSLQWDASVLQLAGIGADRLSTVVPVEEIFYTKPLASLPALAAATPVIIGGSDGALATLGAGSTSGSALSVTIGTSAAVRILSDQPATEKDMSIFCYHALDEKYIIGGASNNGAVVIQWIRDSLLQTTESYHDLFSLAEQIHAEMDELLFIPYILGERAPVWNSNAKGIFFGFTVNHNKAHLIRAAMEGITFNLYSIGRLIMQIVPVTEIYAAGGFAQNAAWLQLLADVFNCKVLVSGSPEGSALGAVMVGIKALQLPVQIQPPVVAAYHPNPLYHDSYQKQFQRFERLYKMLKNEFSPRSHPIPIPA